MAMVCCLACRSQPTIFISASFVPSLLGWIPQSLLGPLRGRRRYDISLICLVRLGAGARVKPPGTYVAHSASPACKHPFRLRRPQKLVYQERLEVTIPAPANRNCPG